MRTTIDQAGRIVVPKRLREQLGLRPGEVEVTADGAALRVEPVSNDEVVAIDGRVVIAPSGSMLTDAMVRDALETGRR